MKIGQFSKLTYDEYFSAMDHYKKYTDFNTLGLFRSITENEKLSVEQKILIRNRALATFGKTFDFLQLKDPHTFFKVSTLGEVLTEGDEQKAWKTIISNQQKILADKRIKHRSFGIYSKHNCAHDCFMNGLMIQKNSPFTEDFMCFKSDKHPYNKKDKALKIKLDRKNQNQLIDKEFDLI